MIEFVCLVLPQWLMVRGDFSLSGSTASILSSSIYVLYIYFTLPPQDQQPPNQLWVLTSFSEQRTQNENIPEKTGLLGTKNRYRKHPEEDKTL